MSKLLVAVVHELDADKVITALQEEGHRVTRIRSTGGYLQIENSTLKRLETLPEAQGLRDASV